MITWTTEKRKVSALIPAPYNPREMTEKQVKDLETSLERFNLADPIVINTDNTIIGGHQRINIYKAHGKMEVEVDVRIPSRKLTPEEEKELNLRLNRNLGQWDLDALANFDEELLKDVGFESKELDRIFQLDTKPEDDDIPEKPPAVCKLGDLWQLGRHRILCGDSTDREQVLRLMDGKNADMVFTDPPYGVGYEGGSSNEKKREKLQGDDTADLYYPTLQMVSQFSNDDVAVYLWFAGMEMLAVIQAVIQADFQVRNLMIWHKLKAHYGSLSAQYKQKHEPFLYLHKKGKSPHWYGDTTQTTVWEIEQSHKNEFHPTQKPVALAEKAITNSSIRDSIVLDLFLGSGSTLIACEKTNRICYGCEIDEHYADVIIKRYEDYAKNKAVKIEN